MYAIAATCHRGYQCDNGECTLSSYDRCDGSRDCSDGSDEQNCISKYRSHYFLSYIVHVHIRGEL